MDPDRPYRPRESVETTYDCAGNPDFTFSIQNPTDPEPVLTRYECRLYIDQNGDGRHTEEERISDLYPGEVTGGSAVQVTENGTLRADAAYTLQLSLNRTQFSGIVAWTLQVVKVGESTVHASEKGYAYIHPASPTAIRVLQIRPHNGSGIDLKPNANFTGLYQELKEANAYDVPMDTTTVNALNRADSSAAVFTQMDLYDMIILGFEDMYGDLNANVAQAVVDYIETGKAVLFTHDTTSFCNVSSNAQWGYYFNQVIRDKVGLDRYGVTSAYYIYNRGNITYSGAGHNTNLTSDEAQLFVNTMIAAYRAVNNPPFVEFRTANDYPAATQLVPVEFGSGASSEALGSEQTIFFKIQDTNLTANKSIAMELFTPPVTPTPWRTLR